jgi:hypothetical protein
VVETTGLVPGTRSILPATAAPGLEISWLTETGSDYQVESSSGPGTFARFRPRIRGDGMRAKLSDSRNVPSKFYRVGETKWSQFE